jgi:2-keto-3-deoxy-L-rhamnonate aldolase RhmA
MSTEAQNQSSALTRLGQAKPVFGLMQTLPNPSLTELAVWSGYDFIILDCEHGIVDEAAQVACLQVISGSRAFAAVRLRPGDFGSVGRYLDFGADAILMADVQSPEGAARFTAAAAFGPHGTRSSTKSTRAARYGLNAIKDIPPPLLLATIESKRAVDNIAAIASTPGIGGLIVGPSDLSADLGCPFDFSAPVYTSAFTQIEQGAAGARIHLGTIAHAGYSVERLLNAGHRIIIVTADIAVLREGFGSQLAAARSHLKNAQSQKP